MSLMAGFSFDVTFPVPTRRFLVLDGLRPRLKTPSAKDDPGSRVAFAVAAVAHSEDAAHLAAIEYAWNRYHAAVEWAKIRSGVIVDVGTYVPMTDDPDCPPRVRAFWDMRRDTGLDAGGLKIVADPLEQTKTTKDDIRALPQAAEDR